ncbi:unnamed protein product [Prunus armeniaca]|uniref:Uncharacterized protein n=1 Tax=Prunus armeniaca TaxID=36596 RepID=A0A6J5THM7_PRUAR|nr:unnamed protein product [Prunus armeniaca]
MEPRSPKYGGPSSNLSPRSRLQLTAQQDLSPSPSSCTHRSLTIYRRDQVQKISPLPKGAHESPFKPLAEGLVSREPPSKIPMNPCRTARVELQLIRGKTKKSCQMFLASQNQKPCRRPSYLAKTRVLAIAC